MKNRNYFSVVFILLFIFMQCGSKNDKNKSNKTKATDTIKNRITSGTANKKLHKKTIILLDVSKSFDKYAEEAVTNIKRYIDAVVLFEDVSLRKIGVNDFDENFIAELDLTSGFTELLRKINRRCDQYSKKERDKCKEMKQKVVGKMEMIFKERKTKFLNKVMQVQCNSEDKTNIIVPIKQCIRDFENSDYGWNRIIIFSDLHDETSQFEKFELNIDNNKAIDEVIVFFAKEKYADLWKKKLKGKNVKIYHIAITKSGFNSFMENKRNIQ